MAFDKIFKKKEKKEEPAKWDKIWEMYEKGDIEPVNALYYAVVDMFAALEGIMTVNNKEDQDERIKSASETVEMFHNANSPVDEKVILKLAEIDIKSHNNSASIVRLYKEAALPTAAIVMENYINFDRKVKGNKAVYIEPGPQTYINALCIDWIQQKGYERLGKSTEGITFPVVDKDAVTEAVKMMMTFRKNAKAYAGTSDPEQLAITYFTKDFLNKCFNEKGLLIDQEGNPVEEDYSEQYKETGIYDLPDYQEYTSTREYKLRYLKFEEELLEDINTNGNKANADPKVIKKTIKKLRKELEL